MMYVAVLYSCFAWAIVWIASLLLPPEIKDVYSCVGCTLLSLIIIYNFYPVVKKKFRDEKVLPHGKAVLITGCDSGFGHLLAQRLDSEGYQVFAGCLFPEGEGAQNLVQKCSDRLNMLELDVTKDESVAEALEYVKENLIASELWAVVNNAGVYHGFDVAWSQVKQFQASLEVNTLGPVRVTKAFLPMLQTSRGRVITLTSASARIALPHAAPYTMSKFAASAFCDCLRLEVEPWDIKVISVEPELYATGITNKENVKKTLKETIECLDADTRADYGHEYFQSFQKLVLQYLENTCGKTYKVVDAIVNAISLKHPDSIYVPCRNVAVRILIQTLENLPICIKEFILKVCLCLVRFPRPREAENVF